MCLSWPLSCQAVYQPSLRYTIVSNSYREVNFASCCVKTYLFVLFLWLFAVQYVVILYGYLKEWWKNPHCSFSCCLTLLLPLNDLQSEIHGLAGTCIVDNQLQSGQMDTTTVMGTVKDSGAIDVSFEEAEQEDGYAKFAVQDENCQDKKHCNKQIQTEICFPAKWRRHNEFLWVQYRYEKQTKNHC